ncbi:type V toxin-antitoxin system endoribonuclease antitoxin GhoS [Salmonella enterica]|nr:type V toxin-antitoxin system endoribonuclease antitoxin GhoS [Salmonella enterica]
MAKFIVRIELRNSKDADYDELHKKMTSHKFFRFSEIDCRLLWLPTAEYEITSTKSINDIASLAKSVAEKISPDPKVLVTEVSNLFQLGLDKY